MMTTLLDNRIFNEWHILVYGEWETTPGQRRNAKGDSLGIGNRPWAPG